jgi:hypothetical protein
LVFGVFCPHDVVGTVGRENRGTDVWALRKKVDVNNRSRQETRTEKLDDVPAVASTVDDDRTRARKTASLYGHQ